MADSSPKSRTVSDDDFPIASDNPTTIRICLEPGCGEPCVKRGRGYAKWCGEHLFNHPNSSDQRAPRSRTISSEDADKKKAAIKKRAEDQIKGLLGFAQIGLAAKGDMYCTWAIGEVGEDIANHTGTLASNIKWMATAVEKSENTFAILMLTLNVVKLGAMIGVHHDMIPYVGPVKMLVPKPPPKDVGTTIPVRIRNMAAKDSEVIDVDSEQVSSSFA